MRRQPTFQLALIVLLSCLLHSPVVSAQGGERWFQVEVSIFTNENDADRNGETWTPGAVPLRYPGTMSRLQDLMDLLVIDDLLVSDTRATAAETQDDTNVVSLEDLIRSTGPMPPRPKGDFQFFDFARDAFVQLPPSESNFQQTNRAIERAAEHRLLYHAVWRQPVKGAAQATPLYIKGGLRYGSVNELQGDITIRFNPNADRVVIDADLWLAEFSIVPDGSVNWSLPNIPARVRRNFEQQQNNDGLEYHIRRIYRLNESRDMRSTEFHYLDHPALGLVILVEPYEVPPAPIFNDRPESALQ